MKKAKDAYEKHAGDFKPAEELEEELEADGLEPGEVEKAHFEEEEI